MSVRILNAPAVVPWHGNTLANSTVATSAHVKRSGRKRVIDMA
jgi:hypothetical protein